MAITTPMASNLKLLSIAAVSLIEFFHNKPHCLKFLSFSLGSNCFQTLLIKTIYKNSEVAREKG